MNETSEPPIVLVDLDGVCADFAAGFEAAVRRLAPQYDPALWRGRFSLWSDDPDRNAITKEIIDGGGFFLEP